jgi:uncharacterized protein YneF (UPF0154 family)
MSHNPVLSLQRLWCGRDFFREKRLKEFIIDNWINILIAIVTYILGILTVYFNQRAKNKALLADNAKLIEETEKIKKEHSLDIEKRKFQYESKKAQYFKYFNMLDDFSAKSTEDFMKDFPPIIAKFNEDFLNANGKKELETKAIVDFSDHISKMTFKANENLIKIKQETNTIKVIANEEILKIFSTMESYYDESLNLSTKLMNALSKMIIMKDDSEVNEAKLKLEEIGQKMNSLKEKLIQEVRKDLNEI